jgi:Domain of unknown function (DUF4388)
VGIGNESPQHALDVLAALDALGLRRRTGKLIALGSGEAYGFYLDRGRMLMACSSWANLRLGCTLVRRGVVGGDRLEHGLLRQTTMTDHAGIGAVLVDDGALTRKELAAAIEDQCVAIMERVFEMTGATYFFDETEPAPRQIEVVPLNTNALVDEAMRRVDERRNLATMQRLMPMPTARLSLSTRISEVALELTDDELSVAIAINRNPQTVLGLVRTLSFDNLHLQRLIIGLRERGLLVMKDAEA